MHEGTSEQLLGLTDHKFILPWPPGWLSVGGGYVGKCTLRPALGYILFLGPDSRFLASCWPSLPVWLKCLCVPEDNGEKV